MSFDAVSSVLVIVPALNEEEGIEWVLQHMPEGFHVSVVDGGSTDETVEVAKQYRAMVIRQRFGRGKGCGVRTGMEFFLDTEHAVLFMVDGDGSNDPTEYPRMIKGMEDEKADVVLGSRIRGKREKGAMDSFSIFSNLIVSLLLGLRFLRIFTDVQTGYWVFSRKAVKTLYPRLKARGFEIEMEIFMSTFDAGLRCIEVPVGYKKRFGKTKFSLFLRFRNFGYMIYYLLRSFF
ncbi:MAG: glycosyltransferase family 2 protein [Candidatus Bathyarchaeota archaeon]|nr:MAG: glycosyltransferase family 2 protein [Candidatus Bathyarchaeota archaeon]